MANKKMTIVEMYEQIKSHLTDPAEIAFIEKRIEITQKKNASHTASDKPTKRQLENAPYVTAITEFLNGCAEAHSVSEMQKYCSALADLSNQKMTGIVTALVKSGVLEKVEVKGKPNKYRLASGTCEE